MAMLEVKGLTMRFGGLTAVENANFEVNEGELVALIGPNGAGKTTIFNVLTGLYDTAEGERTFNGVSLKGENASADCGAGHQPYVPEPSVVSEYAGD